MEKIPTRVQEKSVSIESAVLLGEKTKKKIAKGFLNYAGLLVGIFLLFVVAVVLTTDVKLSSFHDFAALSLAFFVLLFCSYAMYINCADSGMRAGLLSETYCGITAKYDALKQHIVERKIQDKLPEFCRWYVENELKNTRSRILADAAVVYDTYAEKYMGQDKKVIMADANLSQIQKDAVLRANRISPIRLSTEMIFKRGRGSSHRSPLGTKPETKKKVVFATKFLRTCVTSLFMGVIALEMVATPSWTMFASVCLKLLTVILNGFFGYKFGYENIVVDTTNYISDQIDLMEQFLQYVETTDEEAAADNVNQNRNATQAA